jgi:hypothetical protein
MLMAAVQPHQHKVYFLAAAVKAGRMVKVVVADKLKYTFKT